MTWMELCDPSLTHRKFHPVDYLRIVKVLNGAADAKTGFWALIYLYELDIEIL